MTKKSCEITEKTTEILVGFQGEAVIDSLPPGIISWHKIHKSRIVRMKIIESQADDIIRLLKQRRDVRFVEPSRRGNFQCNVDDSEKLTKSDWYEQINGNAIADLSWGAGTLVAVLDTGIDFQNMDMNSRIFKNSDEIVGDLKDNDGNGYIDDYRGWNFGNNDNDAQDENGHGTEVSSIIMSLAPHCSILPVKINKNGEDSFETADLVEGIYYAISLGAGVINLSLTADQELESISEAVKAARDAGIVVVVAAGNDPGMIGFPASMDETIAVGSLYEDQPASFSPEGYELDIMAPGVAIDCIGIDGGKSCVSGTSFSCAMVAGACAVLRGMNNHLKPDTITRLLFSGTKDMGVPGRDSMFGEGAINGDLLFKAASPGLTLPSRPFYAFSRSTSISIGFHLPPADTSFLVFVGILSSNNTLWWLDSHGVWHNADQIIVAPLAKVANLSECIDGTLFGDGGAFPLFDPSWLGSGLFQWVIAITDKSGTLIGPIAYDYMLLF